MTLSEADTQVLITSLAAAASVLIGLWKFYASNKALFDLGGKVLASVVTTVSARTDNKYDDLFAAWLREFTGQLEAKGKAPVSEAKARAIFDKLQAKEAK